MTPAQHALLSALLPLATPTEATGLRMLPSLGSGAVVAPLTQAVGCFCRANPARDARTLALRPQGAPKPTAEQCAEIRRLAADAGIVLS